MINFFSRFITGFLPPKPIISSRNIYYSVAHSGETGAITQHGITENIFSKTAWKGFEEILPKSIYIDLPLKTAINTINNMCKKDDIAIQIHFNMSGLEKCQCGKTVYKGANCKYCSAHSPSKVKFGVLSISWETNYKLCDKINQNIQAITPFQSILKNQLVPDKSVPANERPNSLAWPRMVKCKSIIVEAGFGCDPNFANWLLTSSNQINLGRAVALAVKE